MILGAILALVGVVVVLQVYLVILHLALNDVLKAMLQVLGDKR